MPCFAFCAESDKLLPYYIYSTVTDLPLLMSRRRQIMAPGMCPQGSVNGTIMELTFVYMRFFPFFPWNRAYRVVSGCFFTVLGPFLYPEKHEKPSFFNLSENKDFWCKCRNISCLCKIWLKIQRVFREDLPNAPEFVKFPNFRFVFVPWFYRSHLLAFVFSNISPWFNILKSTTSNHTHLQSKL